MKNRLWIITLLILINQGAVLAQDYQINKVEPPFWWSGMRSSQLQIMVYGDNISELKPRLEYTGIKIDQVIEVSNPNYLFINLSVSPMTDPGSFEIDFLKGSKVKSSYTYRLLEREKGSASRKGFDNSDVMYLITPDRFANGNPSNDNADGLKEKSNRENPGGRHGGDIQGIRDHLDYIEDMGFTAIWVNPVLENDQPQYSYHGYSTTDFYKVDLRFGTNEEYAELAREAKGKGIKLIMDMILNHCGSEHWWMKDVPTEDWINYGGKFIQTNHRRTTVQDPYASEHDHKGFVDGWFVKTMPDLNQRNELLATYLIQNTIWWIEYAGLAGIRMDTYPYPDKDFMTNWTCRVMEEYPDFNIVGEEWSLNPSIVAHWQRGKNNQNGYESCLPSLMDFPVQSALVTALSEEENWNSGFIKLYEMLANDFQYADPSNLVIFPDNHDMSRIYTQLNEDPELLKMALVYTLTMRGIPQIYYGTEVLMKNPGTEDHGVIRSDFPGGWEGDKQNAFTGALGKNQREMQKFVKKLLSWRKTSIVVHNGRLMHYAPENNTYVYFRYSEMDKVMVILNKSDSQLELDLSRFKEQLDDLKIRGVDVITGNVVNAGATLALPEKSCMVIDFD